MERLQRNRWEEVTLTLLRIGTGILFMQHGAPKLFGLLGGFGGEPGATAPLVSLMGLAGVLEFFGGALIVLGLLTRPVAFVLAVEMAIAYFYVHLPQDVWPIKNGGESAALFALIFLYLTARGGGPYSLDGIIGRRKRRGHI